MIIEWLNIMLIPIIILLCGLYLKYKTPSKINGFIGYRTNRSMKSNENWIFANKTCGDCYIIISIILFLITAITYFIYEIDSYIVILTIQLIGTLLPIPIIEIKLKKKDN